MISIPQELVDAILTEVDAESLPACALVASSFRLTSQQRIFRYLVVRYADIPDARSLLVGSPRIAGYVRELRVELELYLAEDNHILARVLTMLPDVERLTLGGGNATWGHLGAPLQSAVLDLLASLDTLSMSHTHDIPASVIFRVLSSVRTFKIDNISLQTNADPTETSRLHGSPFTPRMQNFVLRTTFPSDVLPILDFILQPRTPGYLDNLQQLTVGVNWQTTIQSHRLISATSTLMRALQIRCGGFLAPLELPHLPQLRVIELKVYTGYHGRLPPNLYAAIATFPRAIPAVEVIKFIFYEPEAEPWIADDLGSFPVFDAYGDHLPHLRQVVCHLTFQSPDSFTDFVRSMKAKLPTLCDTGVLTLSCSPFS
ncbi:hypothetical protein C8R44DRAFT_818130 [Mycena epipterygia]|nr:hypothetical protein C8R44DRAFT_818130 [Mycena epipterygia]